MASTALVYFCILTRTSKPRSRKKNFGTETPTNTNAMGYLSLFVSVFRLLTFKFCDKTYATKPFLTITSAQVRFGCICSSCCKLQLFNFATKPFHVTRSAKRPRHNQPIETAIYSMKAKHAFTCHRVFQMVEIDFAATPIHFKLKLFNVFGCFTISE